MQESKKFTWNGFIFTESASLANNNGIKFGKQAFVSKAAFYLIQNAQDRNERELIIKNMKWKEAKLTEKGEAFLKGVAREQTKPKS